MGVYLDTSALAKWYLDEPRSEEFESYLSGLEEPVISSLTVLEMRCLLARCRRDGDFDGVHEARVFAQLEDDVSRGFLLLRPVEDEHARAAVRLIARLQPHPLRSLDALHLAIASARGVEGLATADRIMAAAALELGLEVVRFD